MTLRAFLPHVCGMSQAARESRVLLMLTLQRAFFDEADNGEDFLMGGWIAPFQEWEKFSDAWARELTFSPGIQYFNHNEAMGLKDEFRGWTEAKRDEKMMALAGVIARYNLTGLVGGIKISQVESLFQNSALPKKTLRSVVKFTEPYHIVCQCVVAMTLGYQVVIAKNFTDQVDFIFDEGVPYLDDIIGNYPKLKRVLPAKAQAIAGTIISGNDKKIVALQASDFLSGQKLLQLRVKTQPEPLAVFDDGRIKEFPCYSQPLETIPHSVSKLNVAWATKRLTKIRGVGNRGANEKKKGK